MAEITPTLERKSREKSQGFVSFVLTLEAHEKYLRNQCDLGLVSEKRLQEFQKMTGEMRSKYEANQERAIQEFNQERKKILQDTGIALLEERSLAELQQNVYTAIGIDRYTYKNNIPTQFLKGIVDSMLFDTSELVVLLRDQGPGVLLQMLSWETLAQIFPSIGHAFAGMVVGDAYTRGRSLVQVAFTTIGAVGIAKILLKAGSRVLGKAAVASSSTQQALASGTAVSAETSQAVGKDTKWGIKETLKNTEKAPHPGLEKNGVFEIQPGSKTLLIREIHGTEQEMRKSIIDMIVQHKLEGIDFVPELSHEAKRVLSNMLDQNHPLLEIVRLVPGHELVNINFKGIKALNDAYGQAFMDDLLNTFKNARIAWFDAHNTGSTWSHGRIVRNEYKNLSPSFPKWARPIEALFDQVGDKKSIVEDLIRANRENIAVRARELVVTTGEIEQAIRENFDFVIGSARVPNAASPKGLMRAFYNAEMGSRDMARSSVLEMKSFDKRKQKRTAQKVLKLEKNFAEASEGAHFSYEGSMYPMTAPLESGKHIIHPTLLQAVRKWGKGIEAAVATKVKQYMDTLNRGFDFISPFRNFEKSYQEALRINRNFHEGRIDVKHLMMNHKGAYTSEAFFVLVEGKKGIKLFIDIRDMGIQNLASFRALAGKVAKGDYTFKDLIWAGGDVTDKFTHFLSELEKKYPNAMFSLGGDEVKIFIEGVSEAESHQVLQSINNALARSRLEGRVTHSFATENLREVFAGLDVRAGVNKEIEKVLKVRTTDVHLPTGMTEWEAIKALVSPEARTWLDRIKNGAAVMTEKIKIHLPGESDISIACFAENGLYRFVFTR